tara:strand:- start:27 stop:812 length:786 start_codon:yes stop_codon:yes gene_type:complete
MKSLAKLKVNYKLLNFDVNLYTERDRSEYIPFKTLSECCNHETGLKRYCKGCMKESSWKTGLKGFPLSKDKVIPITADELNSIEKGESKIEIRHFCKIGDIPYKVLDKPYFLEPIDTQSSKIYTLFNNSFAELGNVAICSIILRGSENFAIMRHTQKGLELQLIQKTTDLNIAIEEQKVSADEINLVKEMIKQNLKAFSFKEMDYTYLNEVKELIKAKQNGETIQIKSKTMPKKDNLLDSLKSIVNEKKDKKDKKKVKVCV